MCLGHPLGVGLPRELKSQEEHGKTEAETFVEEARTGE